MLKLTPKMLMLGLAAMAFAKRKTSPSGPAAGPTLNVPKAGARMTVEELRQLAAQSGFPDAALAAAVAMAESGGFIGAVGDQGTSFGLWQIHTPAHPEYNAKSLLDATYNANAARVISKGGTDWRPWTTYKTGAYLAYMPAPAPAITSGTPAAQLESPAAPAPAEHEPSPAPVAVESPVTPAPAEAEELEDLEPVEDVQAEVIEGDGARVRVADEPKGRRRRSRA
jgi:hypothetical protein